MKLFPLWACSVVLLTVPARPDVIGLRCIQTSPTEYKLAYQFTNGTRQVSIFAGNDANQIPSGAPLRTTSSQDVVLHAGKAGERLYFYLKADTGETREVSIRRLPLTGAPNFRDLGGYQTADGRAVRWGLLYRSGYLGDLTAKDYAYLSGLDIRVVCDFRSLKEREVSAETWIPGSTTKQISLPIGGAPAPNKDSSPQSVGLPTASRNVSHPDMEQIYADMAFSSADQYAAVFRQLEEDHLPLLYHCTAGKDRTGIFSVMLLLTLGVPRQTVLSDYALTTEYLGSDPNSPPMQAMMKAAGPDVQKMMANMSPADRQKAMTARPEWIEAMLQKIDTKYGSFDNYRRVALHVSDSDVVKLQDRLTEKL